MPDPVNVELSEDGSRIIIRSGYRDKDLVKKVPAARYEPAGKIWWVPASWPVCHALRGVFGDRLVIGPNLSAWAAGMAAWSASVLDIMAQEDVPGNEEQYTFQRVGTAWMKAVKYGLLTDEMGTGKTVMGCVAIADIMATPDEKTQRLVDHHVGLGNSTLAAHFGEYRAPGLVVCPNSVKRVWLDHLKTWCPGLRAEIVGGKKGGIAERRKTFERLDAGELDVVIMNWESLRLHSRLAPFGDIRLSDKEKEDGELNRHWRFVLADEAHRGKEPRAKQTRALWAASADSEYRWAFTGTPIANAPDELWSLLHYIMPEWWPSKSRWVDRYAMLSWNPFGGLDVVGLNPQTQPELRKTLDVHMLRRTKAEVLPHLPPVILEERFVTLTPKERKAYDDMAKKMVALLEDGGEVVGWNPLVKNTRLLQLASASIKTAEVTDPFDDDEAHYELCEPSSKLDVCEEVLAELGEKQVVIASPSRQLIEMLEVRLEKAKISYGSVHGGVGPDQRANNVADFQAGHLRCMLLTTAAGGEGITLTAADTLIFLRRPDSSVQNKQTLGRVDRIGQVADKVTIIDLITEDTVEDAVFERLYRKGERLEEVVRDKERLKELLLTGVKPAKKAPAKKETVAN